MRLKLVSIFLFGCFYSFGQNIGITKRQLLETFKKSINQPTKGEISIDSNPWIICNKDSSFYLNDTIILYNTINHNQINECCQFIDWTFYKKNAYVQTETQVCKEPAASTTLKKSDWFKIKILKLNSNILVEIRSKSNDLKRFIVLSIDKVLIQDNKIDRIILKRIEHNSK